MTFGTHLRTLRLTQGLTATQAAKAAGVVQQSWKRWESDTTLPKFTRAPQIASALGLPVAQLFTEQVCLPDMHLSESTLTEIRDGGHEANRRVVERIAGTLEPFTWQAATRPPVDLTPGARPKPRRTRVDKLRGVAQANAMRQAAIERRKQAAIDAEA